MLGEQDGGTTKTNSSLEQLRTVHVEGAEYNIHRMNWSWVVVREDHFVATWLWGCTTHVPPLISLIRV